MAGAVQLNGRAMVAVRLSNSFLRVEAFRSLSAVWEPRLFISFFLWFAGQSPHRTFRRGAAPVDWHDHEFSRSWHRLGPHRKVPEILSTTMKRLIRVWRPTTCPTDACWLRGPISRPPFGVAAPRWNGRSRGR